MQPAILVLDTNILLDLPRPEDYRFSGRKVTLVVIPEVMRELRGLSRAPSRGRAGQAMQAVAAIESMAHRRGRDQGIPVARSSAVFRIVPGSGMNEIADGQLVAYAKAEQLRDPKVMVAVVTRDWGVAERARGERVKSILLRDVTSATEIERGMAEHYSVLDIEL
jgi:predicted ribonuclease YlaK